MPPIGEVTYSEAACVAAVSRYFKFLTTMYLDDDAIEWPPEEGWPEITQDALGVLDKSDRVISLLRHLPYFRKTGLPSWEQAQGGPYFNFCNWKDEALRSETTEPSHFRGLRLITESYLSKYMNPHIIGLLEGSRDTPFLLLDTEHGIIYWPDCHGEICDETTLERVEDDSDLWVTKEEADWRGEDTCPAWTIDDFFELLEEQFRELRFMPINSRKVITAYPRGSDYGEMESMLDAIYGDHGWPWSEQYDKKKCLDAVQKALQERYPDFDPS